MRHRALGALIALSVAVCATAISYFALNHSYGKPRTYVLPVEDILAGIASTRSQAGGGPEDNIPSSYYAIITGSVEDAVPLYDYISPLQADNEEVALQRLQEKVAVTGTQVIVYKTEGIAVVPISASIGVTMGIMVFAVWIGHRRMWGEATSTLLEHGLHDMTVRDVEIVGHIMEMKEFTIPELMRRTRASKITVWRTVQKLVGQGLVQPTEQTKLAANGLGGRGKPSHVYKYVGLRESE
ncbi:MAG: helix-turn-helix domain-containing protein [Candidatus Hodarchaeaceae archaeon]|nr:helix-turn-helix domain-containing protein [Candidatus Hodarchaeaceae archaeon]